MFNRSIKPLKPAKTDRSLFKPKVVAIHDKYTAFGQLRKSKETSADTVEVYADKPMSNQNGHLLLATINGHHIPHPSAHPKEYNEALKNYKGDRSQLNLHLANAHGEWGQAAQARGEIAGAMLHNMARNVHMSHHHRENPALSQQAQQPAQAKQQTRSDERSKPRNRAAKNAFNMGLSNKPPARDPGLTGSQMKAKEEAKKWGWGAKKSFRFVLDQLEYLLEKASPEELGAQSSKLQVHSANLPTPEAVKPNPVQRKDISAAAATSVQTHNKNQAALMAHHHTQAAAIVQQHGKHTPESLAHQTQALHHGSQIVGSKDSFKEPTPSSSVSPSEKTAISRVAGNSTSGGNALARKTSASHTAGATFTPQITASSGGHSEKVAVSNLAAKNAPKTEVVQAREKGPSQNVGIRQPLKQKQRQSPSHSEKNAVRDAIAAHKLRNTAEPAAKPHEAAATLTTQEGEKVAESGKKKSGGGWHNALRDLASAASRGARAGYHGGAALAANTGGHVRPFVGNAAGQVRDMGVADQGRQIRRQREQYHREQGMVRNQRFASGQRKEERAEERHGSMQARRHQVMQQAGQKHPVHLQSATATASGKELANKLKEETAKQKLKQAEEKHILDSKHKDENHVQNLTHTDENHVQNLTHTDENHVQNLTHTGERHQQELQHGDNDHRQRHAHTDASHAQTLAQEGASHSQNLVQEREQHQANLSTQAANPQPPSSPPKRRKRRAKPKAAAKSLNSPILYITR